MVRIVTMNGVRPSGYSDAILAEGTIIALSGQIGWDRDHVLKVGFVAQADQALRNIVDLLRSIGEAPTAIIRLNWFVVDMHTYRLARRALGECYRNVLGDHYPTMSVFGVAALVEEEALLEIEATAVTNKPWVENNFNPAEL